MTASPGSTGWTLSPASPMTAALSWSCGASTRRQPGHGTGARAGAGRARAPGAWLVRDGKRVGNVPQRTLEENRARAIADGLRARFVLDEAPGRKRHGEGRAGHGEVREPRMVGARDAIRRLLRDLCAEFANLEAAVEELAPVILPVELPQLGLRRVASDGELLARWSAQGEMVLARAVGDAFSDPAMGGTLLRSSVQAAPGRVSIVLGRWRSWIADPASARDGGSQRGLAPARAGQGRAEARRSRARSPRARPSQQPGRSPPAWQRDNRRNGNRTAERRVTAASSEVAHDRASSTRCRADPRRPGPADAARRPG